MKRSRTDLEKLFGPYTHMLPEEVAIFDRWLQGEGASFAPFDYDVKVGEGLTTLFAPGSEEWKIANAITRKRIDAIAKDGRGVVLIEVKVFAGTIAVGELQTYEVLYRSTFSFTGKIRKMLITDRLQSDMIPVLKAHGIEWREV